MSTISRHKSATSLAPSGPFENELISHFSQKFKGQLNEPFNKMLREKHSAPTGKIKAQYSIHDEASSDLQDYALRHLAYLVAAPTPQKMADVDERMNKLCTYLRPSSKEVEEMVKQAEKGRKRELNLPVDRIHSRLLKESGVKLEQTILMYVLANVEHIIQKILQIAVNYVNQISLPTISAQDIKLLIESFCQDNADTDAKEEGVSYIERFPKTYEDGLKEVMYFEDQFIRQLNIIIRLFREPIERLFPNTPDLNYIFSNVHDILDVTTDLLGAIEDTFEVEEKPMMTGACFCDIMEANGFQHYQQYAADILQRKCRDRLLALLENQKVKEELMIRGRTMQMRLRNEKVHRGPPSQSQSHMLLPGNYNAAGPFGNCEAGDTQSLSSASRGSTATLSLSQGMSSSASLPSNTDYIYERNLMLNAARYLLPRLLLVPIFHFLHYSQILELMVAYSETHDDKSNIRSTLSDMSPLRSHIQGLLANYSTLQVEANRKMKTFFRTRLASTSDKKIANKKLEELQKSVKWEVQWDAIARECNEFIFEGPMYQKSDRRYTDRYVFLFDGILLLCKHNERRGLTGPVAEYKLKRKIPLYRFEVVDVTVRESTEIEEYHVFMIEFEDSMRGDVPAGGELPRERIYLATKNLEEKEDWMATLITLQCWSSMEKFLQLMMTEEDRRQPLCLPSLEQYRFALPDSPHNIVFEEQAENSSDVPLVRGGVLLKLVERLTYHTYVDTRFMKTFMMTYRDFTTPQELHDLLIERFNIPDPVVENKDGEGEADTDLGVSSLQARLKRFKKEYKKPVQLRVINVLRHWVDHHFYDFQRYPELLERQAEALKDVDNRCIAKGVAMISSIIKRAESGQQTRKTFHQLEVKMLGTHLVRDYSSDDHFALMRLHPVELGRQLTLMQFQYYRQIEPSELVGEKWMDKERKHIDAPNVIKTIEFSNKISNWFKFCIVTHEEVNDRVAVMTRICEILFVFEELKNFAGFMEILGVVDSSAIHRLEWTFENMPKRPLGCQEVLDRVRDLMNADHGRKYLEKLRSIDPPCVPFLGTFLTNIDHICVGNADFLDKDKKLINFSKRRKIGEIVAEIQQYQNQSYMHLQDIQECQRFLAELDPFKLANVETEQEFEDFLYERSLKIEPRDCDKLPTFERRLTPEEAKSWDIVKELERLSKNQTRPPGNSSRTGGSSTRSTSPPSPRTNSPSIPTIPESEPLPAPASSPQPVSKPRNAHASVSVAASPNFSQAPPLPRRHAGAAQSSSPPVPPVGSPSNPHWRLNHETEERFLQPKHGYSKSDPVHTVTDGPGGTSPGCLSTSPADSAPPPRPPRLRESSISSGGNPPYSAGLSDASFFSTSVANDCSVSPPPFPSAPPVPPRRRGDASPPVRGPPVPPRPPRSRHHQLPTPPPPPPKLEDVAFAAAMPPPPAPPSFDPATESAMRRMLANEAGPPPPLPPRIAPRR